MSHQIADLKQQAAHTAEDLAEKVKKFESGLKQQAQVTRKTVENFFEDGVSTPVAAGTVLKYQIREHPTYALGIAGVLGFVTTYWFGGAWGPALRQIVKEFDPELKKVKTAAIMLVTKAASSQLKNAYPAFTEKLSDILETKIQN